MNNKTVAAERLEMYRRHVEEGESYTELAKVFKVSPGCVRYWCRRLRRGQSCWNEREYKAPGALSQFDVRVAAKVIAMKVEHPRWGAGHMAWALRRWQEQDEAMQGLKLPARATVGRFVHAQPALRPPRPKPKQLAEPAVRPLAPTEVHECWELDFKMGIPLGDNTFGNLHVIRDVVGETCIMARITPAGAADRPSQRPARVLIPEAMTTVRWGCTLFGTRPKILQTDNEALFVGYTDDDFPGQFTQWLLGLDIEHRTIRPGMPTDNAHVERCHQIIYNHVIYGQTQLPCAVLQPLLLEAVVDLFNFFPSRAKGCRNRTPAEAHPELLSQPRPWRPELEYELFDLGRIDRRLACKAWRRRVNKTGQVSIGGRHHNYSVGSHFAGQDILFTFDPADRHFVFFAQDLNQRDLPADEIARRPARFLTKDRIIGAIEPILPGTLPVLISP